MICIGKAVRLRPRPYVFLLLFFKHEGDEGGRRTRRRGRARPFHDERPGTVCSSHAWFAARGLPTLMGESWFAPRGRPGKPVHVIRLQALAEPSPVSFTVGGRSRDLRKPGDGPSAFDPFDSGSHGAAVAGL